MKNKFLFLQKPGTDPCGQSGEKGANQIAGLGAGTLAVPIDKLPKARLLLLQQAGEVLQEEAFDVALQLRRFDILRNEEHKLQLVPHLTAYRDEA